MAITSIQRYFVGDPNIVSIITTDTLATITTADYITDQADNIREINKGDFEWLDTDLVLIYYSPATRGFFTRDATTEAFVALPANGGVSNSLLSGRIFVGNGSNLATGVAMAGDITINNAGVTAIGANKVLSSMMADNLLHYKTVAITAAEFNGMYATPIELVAAPGANKLLVLDKVDLLMTYGSAAYAAGGVAAVQYDATANGAGVIASSTLSAATFQATASTGWKFLDGVVAQTFTTCVNKSLCLSNITGAFTTGNSPMVAHVWYKIISSV